MLILITHANHLYSDRKQVRKMQPYPPLQALIVAAVLRREGHDVAFFDTTFDKQFEFALDSCRPDLILVVEDNFNFLTKMCLLQNRELAFTIAEAGRARGIPAIVNSSDATGSPHAYLGAGFEAVVSGEPEAALAEICRAGAADRLPIYRGMQAMDLDALPLPAWDLVDIERYRHAWIAAHGYFGLNLAASRGCPYSCNWCAKPIHGDRYRTQSPARVAAELACVQDLFAPDRIWFADDIFGLSLRWLREFAAQAGRSGVSVPFKIQSRCDLMHVDTVAALSQAGCEEVWMGAESGSQRILDRMQKGLRVPQVAEACANLRRYGVRSGLFLQFGYPGEDWTDIEATVQMVRAARPDDVGISVSYPLPGTRLFEMVQERNVYWTDSDDLGSVQIGAFPSAMYRALADALHAEVREGSEAAAAAWEQVESLRCACC